MTSPVSSNTFNLFHKLFLNVAVVIVQEGHLLSVWKLYFVFVSKQKSLYIYIWTKKTIVHRLPVSIVSFFKGPMQFRAILSWSMLHGWMHTFDFSYATFSISIHCTFCLFIKTYFWTFRVNTLICKCPHHHCRKRAFRFSPSRVTKRNVINSAGSLAEKKVQPVLPLSL